MEFIKTKIPDVLLIKPDVFKDVRGFFFESFNASKYQKNEINLEFVQDNISLSQKGTVRGLHYQIEPYAQGKLCQVLKGDVLDVAVDIRYGSPFYGQYVIQELSGDNHYQLFIPPGFAHGFSVLSEEALFSYKCTNYYNKASERAIRFDDPDLDIDWGINNPIMSEKDLQAKFFKQIDKDFLL